MKKFFFTTLANINKKLLPSFKDKDLTKLNNIQKLIIGYRYWVTTRVLDFKKEN